MKRFQGWMHLSRGKAIAVTYMAILVGLLIFGLTVGPILFSRVNGCPSFLNR